MKKLILVATMLAAVCAQAEMKVGTVDLLKLVRNHSSYDSNHQLLETTQKDYQKKLDKMKDAAESLANEGKKMAEQARSPMLAAAAKQKLEKDLADLQQKFMAAQQELRVEAVRSERELSDLEGRLMKSTTDDINAKLQAFAVQNGYDLILNETACPYAKKELDVTNEVLKSMGVDPAKAKEFSDEGK